MDKPETRTLYGLFGEGQNPVTQQAIPWCISHNQQASEVVEIEPEDPRLVCRLAGVDRKWCVISTGGPGHDWWVNV